MKPYYADDAVTLYAGDCLDVLRELPDNSVDAVVCDPPYNLGFMGKAWDTIKAINRTDPVKHRATRSDGKPRTGNSPFTDNSVNGLASAGAPFQAWCELWTAECLRVLRPGGHMLAFGGTRTWHRLVCAAEDAGFEIRDSIAWLYGSGFPKSLDVSKAIDKAAGAEREVVGPPTRHGGGTNGVYAQDTWTQANQATMGALTAPATDAARTWAGWGTALKPAHEPILMARKPLVGTVAQTVLAHGTGALNIDGTRVAGDVPTTVRGVGGHLSRATQAEHGYRPGGDPYANEVVTPQVVEPHAAGRWPANVVLDESQAAALDEQSGVTSSWMSRTDRNIETDNEVYGKAAYRPVGPQNQHGDTGGASRFFYVAKAPKKERPVVEHPDGTRTAHPTVKPVALMRWLVRLVTPPGGIVLDPFAGSGATLEAALLEGFRCIGVEREADYLPLITQRIGKLRDAKAEPEDTLFDLFGEESA